MVYTVIGVFFIMLFGIGIGYEVLWIGDGGGWQEVEELRGSPVKFNLSGHIIPVTEVEYSDVGIAPAKHDLPVGELNDPVVYRCVAFMAVICVCNLNYNMFYKYLKFNFQQHLSHLGLWPLGIIGL